MEVLQQFTTSLTSPTVPVVHTVQYDVVRQIRVRIYAGATVWPVPAGVTAGISYTLPDRKDGYFEQLTDGSAACTIEGNEVTAVVAPILTSVAGTVKAAIVLRQGDKHLSTFPFQIRVTARPGASPKPEAQPDAVSVYVGKLFYGGANGLAVPLGVGDGLEVRDGVLHVLSEWNGSSGVSSWNDLTDKPFTKSESAKTVLLEEQSLAFVLDEASGSYATMIQPGAFVITEGETYTVRWDGTEYTCTGQLFSDDEYGRVTCLGNMLLMGTSEDTGEPFLVVSMVLDGECLDTIGTADTADSHTVGIWQGVEAQWILNESALPMEAIDQRINTIINEALEGDY